LPLICRTLLLLLLIGNSLGGIVGDCGFIIRDLIDLALLGA
jgi:hypothetical protein